MSGYICEHCSRPIPAFDVCGCEGAFNERRAANDRMRGLLFPSQKAAEQEAAPPTRVPDRRDARIAELEKLVSKLSARIVFLEGRSADAAAAATVQFWIDERIRLGKNKPDDIQIAEARRWIAAVKAEAAEGSAEQ